MNNQYAGPVDWPSEKTLDIQLSTFTFILFNFPPTYGL